MKELLLNYLTTQHTKKEILSYLQQHGYDLSERKLRRYIAEINRQYCGEAEVFIAHSPKGYQATTDKKLIKKSILDDRKRALKLLSRYQKTAKKLSEQSQLSLEIYPIQEDIFEILMKGDR